MRRSGVYVHMRIQLLVPTTLVAFTLLPEVLLAASPGPTFPNTTIEMPTLPLVQSAKQATYPAIRLNSTSDRTLHPPTPTLVERPQFFSRMPILVPRAKIDPKIATQPSPAVEYKLLVKRPDIVVTK